MADERHEGGGRPPEREGFPLMPLHDDDGDGTFYKARRGTFESMVDVRHRVMPVPSGEVYNPYGTFPYQARSKGKRKGGAEDKAGGESSQVPAPF